MSIRYIVDRDILQFRGDAIVNTVNCEGVMGKGLALQFRLRYGAMQRGDGPTYLAHYQRNCNEGLLKPGMILPFRLPEGQGAQWILSVATKDQWRQPSRLEWIESILQRFANNHRRLGIASIAWPKLGCGLGDLSWGTQVGPLMARYLGPLPVVSYITIGDQDHQF